MSSKYVWLFITIIISICAIALCAPYWFGVSGPEIHEKPVKIGWARDGGLSNPVYSGTGGVGTGTPRARAVLRGGTVMPCPICGNKSVTVHGPTIDVKKLEAAYHDLLEKYNEAQSRHEIQLALARQDPEEMARLGLSMDGAANRDVTARILLVKVLQHNTCQPLSKEIREQIQKLLGDY